MPPNRLQGKEGRRILDAAISCMHKMLNESKVNKTLLKYTQLLFRSINLNTKKIPHINEKTVEDIKKISETLLGYIVNDGGQYIDIAYCHGDFHQGNILSNGHDYWILDWEHSGYKQICHDLIILLIETRVSNGYSDKLIKLANNKLKDGQLELINSWPSIDWHDTSLRKIYIALFLLEDLNFHIEENMNKVFYTNSMALTPHIKEMDKIVNAIYEKPE